MLNDLLWNIKKKVNVKITLQYGIEKLVILYNDKSLVNGALYASHALIPLNDSHNDVKVLIMLIKVHGDEHWQWKVNVFVAAS